jgi:hypothetical protein
MVILSASETRSALGHQHGPNEDKLFELIRKFIYVDIGTHILNSDTGTFVKNKRVQAWIDRRVILVLRWAQVNFNLSRKLKYILGLDNILLLYNKYSSIGIFRLWSCSINNLQFVIEGLAVEFYIGLLYGKRSFFCLLPITDTFQLKYTGLKCSRCLSVCRYAFSVVSFLRDFGLDLLHDKHLASGDR